MERNHDDKSSEEVITSNVLSDPDKKLQGSCILEYIKPGGIFVDIYRLCSALHKYRAMIIIYLPYIDSGI